MNTVSLTLQEQHSNYLHELLLTIDGKERAAYVLCGQAVINADPWDGQPHQKFISYEVIPVPEDEIVSFSVKHITWKTDSFVRALQAAQAKNLTVAIFHSHREGLREFSTQDDTNEPDLIQLAQNRNGSDTQILSVILMPDGNLIGRLWVSSQEVISLRIIRVTGQKIRLHYPNRGLGVSPPAFQRQALAFGEALNQDLSMLRVGVIGCGGTGSAIAMLLPKMGIRNIALFDKDIVEDTNLNRLHGARQPDADAMSPKVEVVAKSLVELGLGVQVRTYQAWIGEADCRDPLKACDVIFCCTDDHTGRLMLNRFAYYYATPVFDMGLAIEVSQGETPNFQALDGRVTVLVPAPGHACLLCREVINPVAARDEALKRSNPDEYERRKAEAYVIGEGNPSPAVVLFTTEVAIMAMQELVHRFQGFRGEDGAAAHRVRKFHLTTDRKPAAIPNPNCPVCGTAGAQWWGRGDVMPFLNLVEKGMFLRGVVRQLLIWLRFIRQPDLSARIVPTHPAPENIKPGEILVVGDAEYQKWACFRCPGGCGENILLSLNQKRHPCWAIAIDSLGRPTLQPSVRQLNECHCHFWVRQGVVEWCADSGQE